MLLGDVDWGLNSQDIARERHQNESAFIGAINNFEGTIRIGFSRLGLYDSDTIRYAETASKTDATMSKQSILGKLFHDITIALYSRLKFLVLHITQGCQSRGAGQVITSQSEDVGRSFQAPNSVLACHKGAQNQPAADRFAHDDAIGICLAA